MTDPVPSPLDPVDEELAERLHDATPRASPGLRRTVRERVGRAVARQALRPRAAAFVVSGTALLAVAAVVAVTGPH